MALIINPIRSLICALALLFLLFAPSVFAGTTAPKEFANQQKLTPEDQAWGSTADVEMTRKIREELMRDASLSVYARNVKIITIDGKAHLRGPVKSQAEKNRIAAVAKDVTGHAVENDIEIKGDR